MPGVTKRLLAAALDRLHMEKGAVVGPPQLDAALAAPGGGQPPAPGGPPPGAAPPGMDPAAAGGAPPGAPPPGAPPPGGDPSSAPVTADSVKQMIGEAMAAMQQQGAMGGGASKGSGGKNQQMQQLGDLSNRLHAIEKLLAVVVNSSGKPISADMLTNPPPENQVPSDTPDPGLAMSPGPGAASPTGMGPAAGGAPPPEAMKMAFFPPADDRGYMMGRPFGEHKPATESETEKPAAAAMFAPPPASLASVTEEPTSDFERQLKTASMIAKLARSCASA